MLSLDILICTMNSRIVRVPDLLMPEQENVHYVVSFQYTSEEVLSLVPKVLTERKDVTFVKLRGEGLSANRNNALSYARSDLVYVIDDDTRFLPYSVKTILETFHQNPDVDIALFQAQTYAGKSLRNYSPYTHDCTTFHDFFHVLAIEMVCRREKIQGKLFFDARFGLGSHYLSCYEEQIWLEDAKRANLTIRYFANEIIKTSALFIPRLIFVDTKVQRSLGALFFYVYGSASLWKTFFFALSTASKGLSHFIPLVTHMNQGIAYIRKTSKNSHS